MAKLPVFVVLLAIAAIFLTLSEVEGRRRFGKHRRGHRRGHQRDRSHHKHRSMSDLFPFSGLSFSFGMPDSDFFRPSSSWWMSSNWWEGPNVCKEEETEETEMSSFPSLLETCQITPDYVHCSSKVPGKTTTVRYNCCHGFEREKGDHGCPKEIMMIDLITKAEDLGLTDFVEVVKKLGLGAELNAGNFTLFVPENDAFSMDSDLLDTGDGIILKDSPGVIAISEPAVEETLQSFENAILNHVVPGFVRKVDMAADSLLDTANPEGSKIRIISESRGVLANCVPVVSTDHMATNGVIHTVKEILKPVTKSLREIISQRPELNSFKAVVEASGYKPEPKWSGTIWAPTNEAFEQIDQKTRDLIFSSDSKCIQNLIQHHMRDAVQCSTSLAPLFYSMYSKNNETYFRSAKTVETDIMATDGVMHIIDTAFLPDNVFDVLTLLEREGYTEFLGLMEKAGLLETLTSRENITVFAPSNEAIQSLPVAVKTKLRQDPELLRTVLSYHVATKQHMCKRSDNIELPTVAGPSIRLKTPYGYATSGPQTAQCAPVARSDEPPHTFSQWETCRGQVIVGLTNVMIPPQEKVLDVLASDKKFSKFVSLLKKAGMAEMLQGEGTYTVLAPNNEAFEQMDERKLQPYLENPERLKSLIRHHITRNFLCCAELQTPLHLIRTLSGGYLKVGDPVQGQPTIEGASVLKCDQTATNGNVLEVDDIFLHSNWRGSHFDFFNRHSWRRSFLDWIRSLSMELDL